MNNYKYIIKFINYISNIRQYSIHTIRSYQFDLNEYYTYCINKYPNKLFLDLDHKSIQSFIQFLSKKNIKSKTIARKLASIKSFYKYLFINKLIKVNVSKHIKSPKINKDLPNYLSIEEITDLLKIPRGNNRKSLRERLILELFYVTGIRISELVKVKINNIDLREKTIKILGKGKKERIVVFGTNLSDSLNAYLDFKEDKVISNKYLFPALKKHLSNYNKHISVKTVYNIVKKHLKLISNNEKLSPHSLRHTFASHLLDNGADLVAIKNLLGHTSLSSTQIYTHLKPEKLKKIYNKSHPHAK